MLMCGDPGTSKSQLLSFVHKVGISKMLADHMEGPRWSAKTSSKLGSGEEHCSRVFHILAASLVRYSWFQGESIPSSPFRKLSYSLP